MYRFKNSMIRLLLPLFTLMIMTSCGSDDEAHAPKTQIVAKVNGEEISIHQVNQQLSRLGPLNEQQTKLASKQAIKRLIDLQLLEQKAIESKLDRDPQVLQAIQASKQQILAQAYVQREMLGTYKAVAKDVDDFYTSHPELFAQRRLFNLQELAVENGRDNLEAIESAVEGSANISEVAEWLKSKGYKFSLNANVRAAEQLPSKLLEELKLKTDGDMLTVLNGSSVNVISIAASEEQPISKDKATPMIEKYLENKDKEEEMKIQMDAIKQAATIELVGSFADMKLDGSSEENMSSTFDQNESQTNIKSKNNSESTLDKGLEGF